MAKEREKGLGRGLGSLSSDNTPAEQKPLVKRLGAYTGKLREETVRPPLRMNSAAGGRVIVRTDRLPERPNNLSRKARDGTCVILRTERPKEQKRYIPTPVHRKTQSGRSDVKPGRPIVINPRKKSKF